MRTVFKRLGQLLLLILLGLAGYAAYWIFIPGRAPAKRPDLVRLPADAPSAPWGYPTMNAAMLGYLAGLVKPIDIDATPDLTGVIVERDVEYGRVGDRALLLDVYRPEKPAAKPVPLLIFIHGGGWSGGDKRDYQIYTARFAQRGYVCASVGYRFIKESPFPAAVQDTKCAVRWLRLNAARLGADPEKMVAIGGSAGGHLAMMIGYSADVPELEGDGGHAGVSSRVAGVVDLYGPSDLSIPSAHNNPTAVSFIGQSFDAAPDQYALASPLTHLDANDPPTLIFQGTIDTTVPPEQSDLLAEALQKLDKPYWYARLNGWPHTMDIIPAVNAYTDWLITAFVERVVVKGDWGE
jgi:acetyl esterase/lipase